MNNLMTEINICVATINGTGSQKANIILSKAMMRSGLLVTPKNLFPSNIQGAPTWFYIRSSSYIQLGFKKNVDILINLNISTLSKDIELLNDNGILIVGDNVDLSKFDINKNIKKIKVPFNHLVETCGDTTKNRKFLKNMIYLGFLCYYLQINKELFYESIKNEFNDSEILYQLNKNAFEIGLQWSIENNLNKAINLNKKSKLDRILIDGNSASAIGCLFARAQFVSWYPITPSSSLVEEFIRLKETLTVNDENQDRTFAAIQAEDEIASVCMAIGAGWNGARAFTATSGPGLSLMQEAAGFSYYAEIPVVIFNVQRVGPSTGLPTRSAQSDIFAAAFASHGDTMFPLLFPGDPYESFEFAYQAFNIAEQLQTLIFVMSDLDIGMNMWTIDDLKIPMSSLNRGKIADVNYLENLTAHGEVYHRYSDPDFDGVSYRALPATAHHLAGYLTRGSGHSSQAFYTEDPKEYSVVIEKIKKKISQSAEILPSPIIDNNQSHIGFICYGSASMILEELKLILNQHKIKINYLRIRSWPFSDVVGDFINTHDRVIVLDLNLNSQIYQMLKMQFDFDSYKVRSLCHYNGEPINAETCVKFILALVNEKENRHA